MQGRVSSVLNAAGKRSASWRFRAPTCQVRAAICVTPLRVPGAFGIQPSPPQPSIGGRIRREPFQHQLSINLSEASWIKLSKCYAIFDLIVTDIPAVGWGAKYLSMSRNPWAMLRIRTLALSAWKLRIHFGSTYGFFP
ncbi:unnamed protein product [Somion occarium]|uniref:Uncharacterized protein n=1 Tax=Somion occarium TaxID=3059160 RepID=A0ABP1CMT1_9APHY